MAEVSTPITNVEEAYSFIKENARVKDNVNVTLDKSVTRTFMERCGLPKKVQEDITNADKLLINGLARYSNELLIDELKKMKADGAPKEDMRAVVSEAKALGDYRHVTVKTPAYREVRIPGTDKVNVKYATPDTRVVIKRPGIDAEWIEKATRTVEGLLG